MVYVSIKNKKVLNDIVEIFQNNEIKVINDNSNNGDNPFNLIKKAKIVITDLNLNVIKCALSFGKEVIILTDKNRALKIARNYSKHKNIHCSSTIMGVLDLTLNILQKRKKRNLIILFSFIIFLLLFLIFFFLNNNNNHKVKKVKKTDKQVLKVEEKINYKNENIVFTGDSITELYDTDKYYENLPVINTGKSGYKTKDIYDELYEKIYIYNPTKVFLMIGTNDFFDDVDNQYIIDQIKKIINDINDKRPRAMIYLESIYPVNNGDDPKINKDMVHDRSNERIKQINKKIEAFCSNKKNCTYIDIYSHLLDDDGNLKLEYAKDGLHVNDEAYKVITKLLMPYVERVEK